MLRIDHQNGRFSDDQPGANPGAGGRQQRGAVYRTAARGNLRVGGKDPGAARVCRPAQAGQRRPAALPRPDDRFEPGAGNTPDRRVSGDRPGDCSTIPTELLPQYLHGCGRDAARLRRPGARELKRTGHQADFGAGAQRVRSGRLSASGGDLGGAVVPVAQHCSLPQAQRHLSANATHTHSDRRAAQAPAAGRPRIPAYRHRASGRPGRLQGPVSRQCRGRSHAMGDRGGPHRRSPNCGCCRCWRRCCSNSPL